ncbi:hypothetical protein GcM1_213029 [Golovinomyces cichoracearum]|uniref:Uncharacterized protein n=1 Tax=Golovinomyces cichoracearum TaxID=62708 RepID=A0A420IUI5_9PEZI|nr:hypothetical protein GcM1_213029 [Golovinomyces cichoracearum]
MESMGLQNVESKKTPNSGQDFKGYNNQPRQNDSSSLNQYLSNLEKYLSAEYNEYRILDYKSHEFSHHLATLAKIYDNCSKYYEIGDKFDYKFDTFLTKCENADIPKEVLINPFSIILKDDALE